MRSPILGELPPPPQGRRGWPWTEENPQLPDRMPDGQPWPKICIVTPSYNQGAFIEETIRSVLLQGYPNLEYIIIDGGSTDDSIEIIKKYEPWLAYWISEPDRGQTHAINKGFGRASGKIMAWLNSDDYYLKGTLSLAASELRTCGWIVGALELIDEAGNVVGRQEAARVPVPRIDRCFKEKVSVDFHCTQPAWFWNRSTWERVGSLDENAHYCMDAQWMYRALAMGIRPKLIHTPLSRFRYQHGSKTISAGWAFDIERAKLFTSLGLRGTFHLMPSLSVSRYFLWKGLRGKSDALYHQGKRWSSAFVVCFAWLLSGRIRGADHWARLKRALYSHVS